MARGHHQKPGCGQEQTSEVIMLIMRVTGRFFANCKVQYKHAILPSLRFSKGESDHRLGLIIFHPDPLFPWIVCGPQEGLDAQSPGWMEMRSQNCFLSLLSLWFTWGIFDYQPTAALPGVSLSKQLLAIILTCYGQPHTSVPCPFSLPSLGCCSFFPQNPSRDW